MKINLLELSGLKEKISVKPSSHISVYSEGYNKCIRDLSTIEIEFDREELSRIRKEALEEWIMLASYPEGPPVCENDYIIDHIISNSNKIIRVVKK